MCRLSLSNANIEIEYIEIATPGTCLGGCKAVFWSGVHNMSANEGISVSGQLLIFQMVSQIFQSSFKPIRMAFSFL